MNALNRRAVGSYGPGLLPSEAVDPDAGAVRSDPYLFDVRSIPVQGRRQGPGCICCGLPDEERAQLNTMLLSHETFRDISKHFGIDHTSVFRHWMKHVVPVLREFVVGLGELNVDADRIVLDIERSRRRLAEAVERADDTAKPRLANSQVGASKVLLELAGRLKPAGGMVQVNVGGGGAGDDLEVVYSLLRERGEHDLIEAIAARLSGGMMDVTPAENQG